VLLHEGADALAALGDEVRDDNRLHYRQ
jgi:hypothetical protein